ncbi:MAG: hypothetical protein EHM36_01985 [Deltaproteobacteria bacterium]|nr:MAG: hypothetical protein EHM36_01985 [Deltaproteobacteria bacterium]
MFEAFAAAYGWTREYIQGNMTRKQIKLYWHYLNTRKGRELEYLAMVVWGYNPKKKVELAERRKKAEQWAEDPLFDFPNDIEYLTRQQINDKMTASRRFWKRIVPAARWDKERADACIGYYGLVARRCSMNDKLWRIYQEAKGRKVQLRLDQVKKMILIDIKRSKLYPPGWTDDSVDPPQEYIQKLKAEGKYEEILREIDIAAKG